MAKEESAVIVLFEVDPVRDMRIEYPELMKIPEFAKLERKEEVRLCWLIGNRTSPLSSMTDKASRIKKALEMVYGLETINRKKELKEMYDLKDGIESIPARLKDGIERMSWFNPESRLRAKLFTQYIFDTLNEMIVVDNATMKMMDMDDKKKYADLLIKVSSELPDMVKKLEEGYGVKVKSNVTKKEILVDINKIRRG